ncbi:MAG TPA: ATP synthase F1 subunit epsilon [Candidatus Polarisedimenticolaceae bacterium]|nr:ATP synthase F1 subunit epsilon [Candidatus Polarisedimenticolaceae bacterium]
MADTIQLEVLTPGGSVFNEAVREVVIPTTAGALGILPHHTPLAAVAQAGIVDIRHKPEDRTLGHIVITRGLVEVDGERIVLMVDDAAQVKDIDEFNERQRLAKAEERLKSAQEDREIAAAQADILRSTTWLDASKRHK